MIEWEKYLSDDKTIVNLYGNQLSSFSWENCPNSVVYVYLDENQLNSFSWENCPDSIKFVSIYNNKLVSFSWENCHNSFRMINLSHNRLVSFSWNNCPKSIKMVDLTENKISEIIGNAPKGCKVIGLRKVINWDNFEVINDECVICHENGEVVRLKCFETHLYHKDCLENWFFVSAKRNCPLCQIKVN